MKKGKKSSVQQPLPGPLPGFRRRDAVERWNKADIDEQQERQKRALRERDLWGRDPNKVS